MRTRAKVDANQAEIVDALRAAGATVQSLAAVGKGCPDLLVGFRGRNYLLEAKTARGRLTDDQVRWLRAWAGPTPWIVDSVEMARVAIGLWHTENGGRP